jgi:hypothetical protein
VDSSALLRRNSMGETNAADVLFLEAIEASETFLAKLEALRGGNFGWDARQLSIAITDLEASQLRLANARPE